jgi:PAS domain S-box-containing protein
MQLNEAVFTESMAPMFIMDEGGEVTRFNNAAERMSQYQAEEVRPRPVPRTASG